MSDAEAQPARWATEPFVEGTPEQYKRLRDWMTSVQYTEDAIRAVSGAESIAHLKALESGRTAFGQPVDAQSLLVQLFLDSARVPWSVVQSVLSAGELSLLTDLGLLQTSVSGADLCVASVAIAPAEGLYVASDRFTAVEAIGEGIPTDLVYSPLTAETRRFVELMPRVPCESYLELCAGSGIAALHAAKGFAKRAYSADITARSTRFARFNAALNGLDNFVAVEGDLYEPVSGQTFDVITAHPPYVPAETTEMVFRDGGADGEQVTRRIIGGLGDYLRPGGVFYLDCVMTDRVNDSIEQRTRRMLGQSEEEFDVLVVLNGEVNTKVYQADRLRAGRMTPEAFFRQAAMFKDLGITRLVGVTTLIQRRSEPRPVFTRRRTHSAETRAGDLLWLARYLRETVGWGAEETRELLDSRPRALPNVRLHVRSALRDGQWAPLDSRVETTAPFATDSECPPWFPVLLARCDGRTTVRALFERMNADGVLPEATTTDDFAQMIREVAEVPFVELERCPLPAELPRMSSSIA